MIFLIFINTKTQRNEVYSGNKDNKRLKSRRNASPPRGIRGAPFNS